MRRPFQPSRGQARALDLSRHVLLGAGAGSGKTAVLVERFLRGAGQSGADGVVAITFTEKAAGEMRSRLLGEVNLRLAEASRESNDQALNAWSEIKESLPRAQVSTIHAFAGGLLREFALEAGVDPAFDVQQPADAAVFLEETLTDLVDRWARGAGSAHDHVERLARAWGRSRLVEFLRDRLADRERSRAWVAAVRDAGDTPALVARWAEQYGFATETQVVGALQRMPLGMVRQMAQQARELDLPQSTVKKALDVAEAFAAFEEALADGTSVLAAMGRHPAAFFVQSGGVRKVAGIGRKGDWKAAGVDRTPLDSALKECFGLAKEVFPGGAASAGLHNDRLADLVFALAHLTGEALEVCQLERLRAGSMDFDDLIEQAANLLDRRGAAYRSIRSRVRHLLVDEFQDTDALQWRIVQRLVEADPDDAAGCLLFVVGDKKQGIYSFRGADVAVFDEAEAWVREVNDSDDAGVHELSECRRALPELLEAVNGIFEHVLQPQEGEHAAFETRPQALSPARSLGANAPAGSLSLLLSPAEPEEPEDDERPAGTAGFREALGQADLIARHLRLLEQESAAGAHTGRVLGRGPDATEQPRPLELSDVAILLRRRSNLKLYEDALRRHSVPFTVWGGVGFYEAQEVQDVTNLVRALADVRDEIALAGWLRSPMANVSDDALVCLARAGKSRSLGQRFRGALQDSSFLPATDRTVVARAARLLAFLQARADRMPLSELLHVALDRSGAWAAYAGGLRGGQVVANLRKILDQARAFDEVGHAGLAGLARFADRLHVLALRDQVEGEAPLPEGPRRGVQLLTIHGAKGLEWPVVVVPELEAPFNLGRNWVHADELRTKRGGGQFEIAFKVQADDPRDEDLRPGLYLAMRNESRLRTYAEEKRLLYVACTRARDHLVLCGSLKAKEDRLHLGRAQTRLRWVLEALGLQREDFHELLSQPERQIGSIAGGSYRARVVTPLNIEEWLAKGRDAAAESREVTVGSWSEAQLEAAIAELQTTEPMPTVVIRPSRLKVFQTCPLKFHFGEWIGVSEGELWLGGDRNLSRSSVAKSLSDEERAERAARRGHVVHRVLELGWRPDRPRFETDVAAIAQELGVRPAASEAAVEAAKHAARVCFGDKGILRGMGQTLHEVPFAFGLADGLVLVRGTVDLVVLAADRPLIIDFKSDEGVRSAEEARKVAESAGYLHQIRVYALAVHALLAKDADRIETSLLFTRHGVEYRRSYDATELAQVRTELEAMARKAVDMAAGKLEPPKDPPCGSCAYGQLGICPVGADRPESEN